ncbi:protein ENHANCED DISEASE RESISTANCE 2-like [Salvia splendens]|uniref:protein ENHANCED DISEASE RESISTANCE 2-like n=1 Tax=Salvia splendens TaxID=180675 RepID=UPI001C269337|nr:protein ENHANCED DISEASE RESISTANCE 2-like [Salvia splendens]XP_042038882.1 protein ENHANCED DISEASE RESISTANCE 2-like [Salvia splendens]XP_042038883.1 protein ENHANCED DISEASE RESISTANCE 2-like [Salvia splendens]
MSNPKVVYEGWMVRYGRRKIGRSFIHMRYFVLESRLLAYYKKKPQDNVVPTKTLLIDGNCRVEDRGLKTHNGHMVYVLSIYNKKEKYNRITMAAFNIQEALIWKEKIESVIDQHQESQATNGNKYISFEYKSGVDNGRNASSSEHDSQYSAAEDEDDSHRSLLRRTTIGNGPPESVYDWTKEFDSDLVNQNSNNQAFSRKHWRLLQCQNGLRIFEELDEVDILPKSCSRAMKAVGVVEATCEEIFELIMGMDTTRCEWDCSFQYGSLVEEVDGHTAILYHRLQLDWFPLFVWPRDLCYVRYWRRNDDGSYVVLFRSREHENCGPQPGFVRAHIESGGYNISPLKPRNGRPRTQVQHLMQIDLKGWGVGYVSSFQQHCLLQMLNSVAGLREYYSQTDDRPVAPRIPVMVNMTSVSSSSKKSKKLQSSAHHHSPSLDQIHAANRNSVLLDEYSDDDEDLQADQEAMPSTFEIEDKRTGYEEESTDQIDLSIFSGNLRRDDHDKARNCWTLSNGNNFRVRSKRFCYDKSKIPAGKHLMDLVAVDWFKDKKRMDHVARRPGCAAQVASDKGLFSIVFNLQVPGSTHYSMVFYFVTKELVPGSLLQRFVDGDDEFRNSRLKLIPSVPKGSWIVRQSVGSTPCLLGKAVDCNYIRGPKYLEVDIDIGSSTVANGVLGLVVGVITTLVVDMAFLIQANSTNELPERLIGAVRVSHIELSSAIVPVLETDPSDSLKSENMDT